MHRSTTARQMEGEASSLPAAYGRELAASGPVKANESIRVAVKAVIIQDGKLLVTKNTDPWGDFYLHDFVAWSTASEKTMSGLEGTVRVVKVAPPGNAGDTDELRIVQTWTFGGRKEGVPVAEFAVFPSVAIDRDGVAHLAWEEYLGRTFDIFYARLETGEGKARPEVLRVTRDLPNSRLAEVIVNGASPLVLWKELSGLEDRTLVLAVAEGQRPLWWQRAGLCFGSRGGGERITEVFLFFLTAALFAAVGVLRALPAIMVLLVAIRWARRQRFFQTERLAGGLLVLTVSSWLYLSSVYLPSLFGGDGATVPLGSKHTLAVFAVRGGGGQCLI